MAIPRRVLERLNASNRVSGFVPPSPEFDRVMALPYECWQDREDLDELIGLMTRAYRLPEGEQELRPVQAVFLEALYDYRGAFGGIGVGEGKSLIAWLAGVVLGAKRVAILVPAGLEEDLKREFDKYAKHWKAPEGYQIFKYSMISRNQGLLEEYGPDLVVADEVDALKSPSAACAKRVVRFLAANPEIPFAAMSGTISDRSPLDFHHLLALTVGPERMPLPGMREECDLWARCIGEKVEVRSLPGAFATVVNPCTYASVRRFVGRRIRESPGVIFTDSISVKAKIDLELREVPVVSMAIREKIHRMRKYRIAPNGEDELYPGDLYRHSRTLFSGFYYDWDPRPPQIWLKVRKRWRKFVISVLENGDPEFDTEGDVQRACENGRLPAAPWLEWKEIRKIYRKTEVTHWLSLDVLNYALDLVREPTIIWVDYRATGKKLEEISGLTYYGEKGMSSDGRFILDEKPGNSLIASVGANCTGRNLQAWGHNLLILPVGQGRTMEQLLGRTHRPGQMRDRVSTKILVPDASLYDQWDQALADAAYAHDVVGPQRLITFAEILDPRSTSKNKNKNKNKRK